MFKNTKEIIKGNFFPVIPMGAIKYSPIRLVSTYILPANVIPMGAIRYCCPIRLFPDLIYYLRSGWFRLIYYLQKIQEFAGSDLYTTCKRCKTFGKFQPDSFKTERLVCASPIALKLRD